MSTCSLGWWGIVRLGLVQTALGAVIVLTTSTINRIMVVELGLAAMVPGFLVALHHVVQMSRPRFGYGSDIGGRRTPWILGGMFVLATGGFGAAVGTAMLANAVSGGMLVAMISFVLIGLGSGAAGTSLLVLLADQVEAKRKAAAATIVWIMMIAGFAITAGVAGSFLDPYSPGRLVAVSGVVSIVALTISVLALLGVENRERRVRPATALDSGVTEGAASFRTALRQVWQESQARRFTIFVFVSMLAYSAQDLILEPYAGTVFDMTPGESTSLSGLQHSGVLLGMLVLAVTVTMTSRGGATVLRRWTVGGCLASAAALAGIALGGHLSSEWPLRANVFLLGLANGVFAVSAIASMMTLANHGSAQREGLRMGLWGASQAIAFALGGFLGTVAIDLARAMFSDPAQAYALVFGAEAALFVVAAGIGAYAQGEEIDTARRDAPRFGDVAVAQVLGGR
ncbi:MAG: BCD family MFS transporter [Pseudomonadota bacterium]